MASIFSLFIRGRTKLPNLNYFTRKYSNVKQFNRLSNRNNTIFYLIGGGLVTFTCVKLKNLSTVYAFNPKKIQVSLLFITIIIADLC